LNFSCIFERTGESRGFAFVRYKYADEASKAVDMLDGIYFLLIYFIYLEEKKGFLFNVNL